MPDYWDLLEGMPYMETESVSSHLGLANWLLLSNYVNKLNENSPDSFEKFAIKYLGLYNKKCYEQVVILNLKDYEFLSWARYNIYNLYCSHKNFIKLYESSLKKYIIPNKSNKLESLSDGTKKKYIF